MAPLRRRRSGAPAPLFGARANDNDQARSDAAGAAPSADAHAHAHGLESIESRLDALESACSPLANDSATDLVDVPAAVVCLVCGEADCTGCEDRDLSRSGIVAIVAWERPGLPAMTRLWSTARSTTRDAESFFELLPDGPVLPALRFAAICEMLATASMLLLVVPIAAVLKPDWLRHVAFDPAARSFALRLIFLGVPVLASFLVFAHTIHALFIDIGAAKSGARRSRSRALRFGLYACGWDLVMGPLGMVIVAFKEGLAAAAGVLELVDVPRRATHAFLRGAYRLEGERAKKAVASASTGALLATLFGFVAVVGAIIALSLV